MSDNEPRQPTPQLLIEKLAAGELDAADAKAVRARLEAEPDGLTRLTAIERSNAEVLAAYPAARMTRDIEDKLRVSRAREESGARRSPWWIGLPVAATAALLLFVVLPSALEPNGVSDEETILTKGSEPRLRVFVEDAGGSRPLRAGEVLGAGDVLQLAYVAAGSSHGVVVSIDGRGQVTRHLPERGDEAAALKASGAVRLPHAYELDDAPRFERFFFVTSSSPFALPVVLEAARSLAASGGGRSSSLALPAELSQVSFLVEKDGGGGER